MSRIGKKGFTLLLLGIVMGGLLASASVAWGDTYFTAYYGTTNTTGYNTAAANWTGGTVWRDRRTSDDQLGTSSHLISSSNSGGEKSFRVRPANGYRVVSVKRCRASYDWSADVSWTGTWYDVPDVAANQTSEFDFSFDTTDGYEYLIWVVFAPVNPTGGQVGAWYGTNNTTLPNGYNTPVADGSGGTVWKTTGTNVQMGNKDADAFSRTGDGSTTFQVRPDTANNFRIGWIKIGTTLAPTSWNDITVADPAADTSFNIAISGGNQYVIWVKFYAISTTYTVTGSVDAATDTTVCTGNAVTASPQTINSGHTATFNLATSTNCEVDCVNFNSGGCVAASGTQFTTPAITVDSTVVVKFKPIKFNIDALVDSSSPTGCGSISPAGTVAGGNPIKVDKGGSQAFTITTNTGCSISHVYVTDANRSWTAHDLVPMSGTTYTFQNVQADGIIKVYFVALQPASGLDYCQIPPFVQGRSDLVPNLLVVFDNSGSMGGTDTDGYAYYNNKTYGCTATHNGLAGDSPAPTKPCNTRFYGYFEPTQMYKVDTSNSNVYVKSNVTLNLSSSGASGNYSGNYLNWRYMHKVDVIRKVLVGGRVTAKASNDILTSADRASTATKYLYSDIGKWVEYGAGAPTGLVQEYSGRVRFGLEVFGSTTNSNSDGGKIVTKIGAPLADMVTAIEGSATNPVTSTPIAEALYEAIRYFQAKPSAYNSSTNYGDEATWAPSTVIQFACQKNFVLLLTDGEANNIDKLPGLSGNPSLNSYTDTTFNVTTWSGRIPSADRPSGNDGLYTAAVGYMGHVNDIRTTTFGNNMLGTQYLTFYTVYAFGDGTGTKTLQMLSKYGGFASKNGNDAGTAPNKYASPDQAKEWDSNADNIPDTYFEGDDGDVIGANIAEALRSMIANVSSGTAASILANSEGSGANLLQAIFYPNKVFDGQTDANWTGELHNLWYFIDPFVSKSSVREDTDYVSGDTHYLNLLSDYVVNYYFDVENTKTMVSLYQDTDGDGDGDTQINIGVDPDAVKSIWRAGRNLWARDPATRKIYTPCSIKNGTCLACLGSGCPGGSTNSGLMAFTTANNTKFTSYLQATDATQASTFIDYVRGVDATNYRSRTVTLASPSGTHVWKLGDIISSTPRLESNMKLNSYDIAKPAGYGDTSYADDRYKTGFVYTPTYKNRGMVFAGANDGMLHAFKLGILDVTASGDRRATLTGSGLGEEEWAFIPSHSLPYLKYMSDPAYGDKFHVNYIDGNTTVADVSIGISAGCSETTDYWKCGKDTANGTNWRTIVIGSMGTGGATRIRGDSSCGNCVNTPIFDPNDNTKGFGYSTYFALDVTDPANPTFLWEFFAPGLGFATSGPAIVKLATTTSSGAVDKTKNGRWFAVFASGPTGPISTRQFHGRSNQQLKVFVVDLKTGALLATIDKLADGSTLDNAFGGAIFNNVLDTDRGTDASAGFYQDDVVYMGYTQANESPLTAATTWTNGGLLRLVTGEKLNADGTLDTTTGWKLSKVIDGIGPVGSNIGKIVDRKNSSLWLYFGTGRYFDSGDDQTGQQRLFGIKEPCYKATVTHADSSVTKKDIDDNNCTTKLTTSNLDNQTSTPSATLNAATNSGWYINLDLQNAPLDAERVLTDPVATLNGVVFFTTFKPTSDVCSFGGETNIWAVGYDNGAAPPAGRLNGKALLQLSTGSFTEVDLGSAFSANEGRKTTTPLVGKPPSDAMPLISSSQNRPVKKMLHIREK